MKRNIKKGSLYQFLEKSGVLINGSDENIKGAKRQYWALYKANWRKQKRQACKEIRISLTQNEMKILAGSAKKYKRSKSLFLKEMALANIQNQFLPLDSLALYEIRQLLVMNYSALKRLFDSNLIPFQVGITALNEVKELESKIMELLYSPKLLEDAVVSAVRNNQEYKTALLKLIKANAYDNQDP